MTSGFWYGSQARLPDFPLRRPDITVSLCYLITCVLPFASSTIHFHPSSLPSSMPSVTSPSFPLPLLQEFAKNLFDACVTRGRPWYWQLRFLLEQMPTSASCLKFNTCAQFVRTSYFSVCLCLVKDRRHMSLCKSTARAARMIQNVLLNVLASIFPLVVRMPWEKALLVPGLPTFTVPYF